MKNTGLKLQMFLRKINFMSNLVFHTIRELKLSVRVLVVSVLNVNELIRGLVRSRTLKKQCMHR